MNLLKSATIVVLSLAMAVPAFAHEAHLDPDRIENRMDRRENRRDEAVDHGPLDVIEDHLDRAEDRRDYRDVNEAPKVIIIPNS